MYNWIFLVQRLDGPLASNGEETNFILLTGIWVIVALALYFMRPNPARKRDETIKNLPGGSGNSGSDVRIKNKLFWTLFNVQMKSCFYFQDPPPPSMGAQW